MSLAGIHHTFALPAINTLPLDVSEIRDDNDDDSSCGSLQLTTNLSADDMFSDLSLTNCKPDCMPLLTDREMTNIVDAPVRKFRRLKGLSAGEP